LQVKLELVAASQRQLTEQVVAEPKVASRVVESDFKLRPRTIEEVRSVNILLDQQRDAVGCRTIYIFYLYLFIYFSIYLVMERFGGTCPLFSPWLRHC